MMQHLVIVFVAVSLICADLVPAQTTQQQHQAEVEAEIARSRLRILVASLCASDVRVQEEAQAQLIAINEGVAETIKEMKDEVNNADAAPRVRQILRRVHLDSPVHAMLRPTLVTLHVERKPAREVLQ